MLLRYLKNQRLLTFLIFIVIFTGLFFAGLSVSADNRSYEISAYTVNVNINPDGTADIDERITYSFDGEFNGVLRDVDYSSTGGLENPKVYVFEKGNLTEIKLNSTNNLDAGGINGTYNLVKDNRLAHFKIFVKSKDEDKTFVIRYTFKDAVTKYSDIAEFNRKMVDSNWDVRLNNVTVNFTLPEGAQQDEIKVFGHGSLLGESKILDERHVQFTVPNVNPGELVETLVLFPTRLVPQVDRVVDKAALPRIMENEKGLAEEANRQREEAQKQLEREEMMRTVGNFITIPLFIFWFLIIIHIYRKYDKELKHSFEGKYYRELPGDYTPAEMSSLLSMGSIQSQDITATLMDLVRKKQLLLTTEKTITKGFFRNKEENEYVVSLNPKAPAAALKKHETFLMDWFINNIGDGSKVSLDEISVYAKTVSKARRFKKDYDEWCLLAKEEAEKNNFFDHTCKRGTIIGILASLAYLVFGLLLLIIFGSMGGVALLLQFVILLIFSARISRRTAYGNEQKAMWDAFKNFLKDFSRMDKAEIPSIVIWEHYLVYAISLGVAKQVIKQLPLVFADTDLDDSRLTYMHGYQRYATFVMLSNSLDKTVDSVDSAINNAMSVANSTLSSKSGSGGGFSGGSSGGGGGGGGGGAF